LKKYERMGQNTRGAKNKDKDCHETEDFLKNVVQSNLLEEQWEMREQI
jgi:hypothetical protein